MITNSNSNTFDVIEITNEMPINRIGGVGSVIENLISGFRSIDIKALWFLVDHNYHDFEIARILKEIPDVAIGSYNELRHFHAPIIHLHIYNCNPQLFEFISGAKVVFTIHSLLVLEARSNDVDLSQSVNQQESLIAASDKIVVVSRAELENYREYNYQTLNPDVSVIHNGLKRSKKFNNHRDGRGIGFCGRLVPRKRPEYVQNILKEKGFENHFALIAGRGFSTYARDLMEDPDLKKRVRYLGWCGGARLESFYDTIALLATPSTYEPFGMAALEAVTRGIPVICAREGGLVEMLGDHAFYSQGGSSYPSFREAMYRWLLADSNTVRRITEGALELYHTEFTDLSMAKNI